jgi:hypothetical protein
MSSVPAPTDEDAAVAVRFLYRPIVFLEPERAVAPPSWLDYAPFAFWIVDALRPSTFVELGCHSGNSYASFAQAVQALGLPAACYGVDTWRGDPHAGHFDETVFEEWSAYHNRRFATFSQLIRATFDDTVEHFASGSIDLLHIDGYHTFEGASHDFEAWRSKLSPKGVVLCHDINVRERDFGAWRLWERVRDEYPCFEFLHGHGLGVLGIGRDLPEAVRWLLSLRSHNPESVNTVRLFFSRLGAAVLSRYTATEAQRTFRAELAARDEQLAQATGDAAQLASALASSDAQLAERAHETARLESDITSLHERLSTLSNDLDQRDERLAGATANVARLSDELAESERCLDEAKSDVTRLSDAIGAAEESLVRRAAEVERLSSRLESREAHRAERARETARLLAQIGGLHQRVSELSTDLDWRDAQLAHLESKLDAGTRAVSAGDETIRKLDCEAAALLERLQHETSGLSQETTRRKNLETLLSWSQGQVLELATRRPSGRITALNALGAVSRMVATAVRSAGHRARALAEVFRIAAVPSRLRDFILIEASGLFDEAYYLERNPDVAASGVPALVHFVLAGERDGSDPHPLFSTAYYASQVSDLAGGSNALRHYLTRGWRTGCAPHPLFDPAYYLTSYPDVAATGASPLEHFIRFGWREGKNPSAVFSVQDYLARHPDLAASGENPLVHYLQHGQGHEAIARSPVRQSRGRPNDTSRVELTARSLAPQQDSRPTIVVVSHVGPWRPKAGNEYRVHRMLRWYQQQEYRLLPLVAPLPGEELTREAVEGIAAEFGNAIEVHRDGRIEYCLRDLPDVFASLTGTFTSSFADILGEDAVTSPRQRELISLERTFCHDAVISTVLHLERSLGPHILQVEYIWMTRLLPLVRGDVLKVIDTHDVLSSIPQKVTQFDVRDVVIEPDEEAERLRRADLAIAIQDDERAELKRLAPSVPIVTAGVDFDVVGDQRVPTEGQILFVASDNARNRKGLDDFLRLAWPRIRHSVPKAELLVVGGVGKVLAGREVSGVGVVGRVEDLTPRYENATLVINPVVAGTGLKIKILEALCHLRPVVTWPAGVEGLDPMLSALCLVARDWYEFSEQVIGVLTRAPAAGFTDRNRAVISALVAPEHVYASLNDAYRAFFEQHQPATRPIGLTRPVSASPMVAHARD